MAYSFRGINNTVKIASSQEAKPPNKSSPINDIKFNDKPSIDMNQNENPFIDVQSPKIIEQEQEPVLDINQIIKKKSYDKIISSPDLILSKKKVNDKGKGKKILEQFAIKQISAESKTESQCNNKQLKFDSFDKNPVQISRRDQVDDTKGSIIKMPNNSDMGTGYIYNSPKNRVACCDKRRKGIGCVCTVIWYLFINSIYITSMLTIELVC